MPLKVAHPDTANFHPISDSAGFLNSVARALQAFTAGFTSDSVGGDRGAQAQIRILGLANQK